MKKNLTRLMAMLFCVIIIGGAFSACSGKDAETTTAAETQAAGDTTAADETTATAETTAAESDTKTDAKGALVGTWSCDYEGIGTFVYTFNKDGTGVYDVAGDKKGFTYTDKGDKFEILWDEDKDDPNTMTLDLEYKIDGDKLIVTDSLGEPVEYIKQ